MELVGNRGDDEVFQRLWEQCEKTGARAAPVFTIFSQQAMRQHLQRLLL